jgi:BASS family bile acid:Na+ symporter
MNVVMPILAALIVRVLDLRPEVGAALILLAVSPVPPTLTGKQGKAGANLSYAIGLLAVSAVVAIVAVPLSVAFIGRLFGRELSIPVAKIAVVVAKTVIVPLLAGGIVRSFAPSFARRASAPLTKIAMIVLLLGLVMIVATMWRGIIGAIGDRTLLGIVAFTLVSLAVGHLLGGPDFDDRTVLALSTANRHPGVAITVAGVIVASQAKAEVAATVLLCVIVGTIVTTPYVRWRKHGHLLSGTPIHSPAR